MSDGSFKMTLSGVLPADHVKVKTVSLPTVESIGTYPVTVYGGD